ncbi:MAG: DJ-1/PfpI family protein [Candidatus Micrarchaeota archaeon]
MTKILMIVAQNGFRDEEFVVPKEILEHAGHKITVASITRTKATGMKGLVIQPEMSVFEANPEFFGAIIVVGGSGSPALAQSKDVTDVLMAANNKAKVIGGICLGVMALASAGILANKNATVFPDRDAIVHLKNNGARYTTDHVVIDGKIVTADGPSNAGKFGVAIAGLLK